ncbi:single-stranded DNA-binding protein [Kingella potus]|uniref:single-stranded DNA-binding protein n=1 Tax=Kingella potus TaxID=265175 RepID=UPI001FCFDE53|nr:single-stranded DNA-binding protein [Kingella potus]UOP01129.1 single-stranded DNA-binding protein [Kingella potus]
MSVNKVILIGTVSYRDPEVRYMPNGDPVCNFTMATSETWNDRQSGQRQERTEWHNITMYRRLAEISGQYLKKGSQIYIEGRIQSRKYQDRDGNERTAYEIIANEMKMLDSRQSGGGAPYQEGGYPQAAPQQQQYRQEAPPQYSSEPPAAPARRQSAAPAAPVEDIDDDIPF